MITKIRPLGNKFANEKLKLKASLMVSIRYNIKCKIFTICRGSEIDTLYSNTNINKNSKIYANYTKKYIHTFIT